MYRVTTLNVNGIRAAARKGFFTWLERQQADVICLQEVRAGVEQISADGFWPEGYTCVYRPAARRGYSGVALFSRRQPDLVVESVGFPQADEEGRILEMRFDSHSVVSLYLPSGSSGEHRQQSKYEFLDWLEGWLKALRDSGREYLICGDWNIAHRREDLKNWRSNQKNSGFLPEERAWMDQLFGPLGFVDVFRRLNQDPDQYTWWSNRGNAWANNVGWRIDYQVATPGLAQKAARAAIYRKERFSDHAPLTIDYLL